MKPSQSLPYLLSKGLSAVLILLFTCPNQSVQAQSSVRGRIHDAVLDKDCPLAVVAILRLDSTLLQFTRSRKDGSFLIDHVDGGRYLILVTHPTHDPYIQPLLLKNLMNSDLGQLSLSPKSDTLASVIVTPTTVSPRMRGDTLEFNTAHVKTKINATVEELLTRLPGVQVDPNGTITVNGKKIDRLLVDGEDFFGGNPTIVTRNFNADMIAKVQILDKRSAQSEFTGVDDGQRTHTLNLTLKADSKRGNFGKTEVGGDPQSYYSINGLMGAFKDRQQVAGLGMAANTGATGFSSSIGDQGSGLMFGASSSDALGASAGAGIPRVIGAGMHFSNKWDGSGNHLLGNANYGQLMTSPYSSVITRQTLPDSIYIQQLESHSRNTGDQLTFNTVFDYNPDTVSAFQFSISGNCTHGNNEFSSTGQSSFNDTLVNSSTRNILSADQNQMFRGSVYLRLRSAQRRNRNLSVLASISSSNHATNGFLHSINNFYLPNGVLSQTGVVDQRKAIIGNSFLVSGEISYTSQLWRNAILAFSYNVSFNRDESLLSTYGRGNGEYSVRIDSLSNHFQNAVVLQRGLLNIQATGRRFSYTIGGDLLHSAYRQGDLGKNSSLHYQYINFVPRINARYNINEFKGFNLDYNGSTQPPSISQLQPVQNNTDPLHLVLGNPNLKQGFSHNVGVNFQELKPMVFTIGVNFGLTTQSISTRTITDSLGRQVSQAVNVDGFKNGTCYLSISKKIKPIDLELEWNGNFGYGHSANYVNQYLNNNKSYNTGSGITVSKFVVGSYSIRFNANVNYFFSSSSINTAAATHYFTQNHSAQLSLFPVSGWEITTNGYYTWRQKLDEFDKKNVNILWNAFVSKTLLSNRLILRWQVNDILAQNAGVSRTSSANQTTESISNILGRYWIVSASWRWIHHRDGK